MGTFVGICLIYNTPPPKKKHNKNKIQNRKIKTVCFIFTPTSPSFHLKEQSVLRTATDWEVRGSNSGTANRNFSTTNRQSQRRTHPLLNEYLGSYASDKTAGGKNEWSHTVTPPICHHAVNRDKFTFTATPPTSIDP